MSRHLRVLLLLQASSPAHEGVGLWTGLGAVLGASCGTGGATGQWPTPSNWLPRPPAPWSPVAWLLRLGGAVPGPWTWVRLAEGEAAGEIPAHPGTVVCCHHVAPPESASTHVWAPQAQCPRPGDCGRPQGDLCPRVGPRQRNAVACAEGRRADSLTAAAEVLGGRGTAFLEGDTEGTQEGLTAERVLDRWGPRLLQARGAGTASREPLTGSPRVPGSPAMPASCPGSRKVGPDPVSDWSDQ